MSEKKPLIEYHRLYLPADDFYAGVASVLAWAKRYPGIHQASLMVVEQGLADYFKAKDKKFDRALFEAQCRIGEAEGE